MTDTSDLAFAALKHDGRGPCNCYRFTNDRKPYIRCEKCHGTGTVTACLRCGGSGWDGNTNSTCRWCESKGYLPPQHLARRA